MNQQPATVDKKPTALSIYGTQLDTADERLKALLPSHITLDQFKNVCKTAAARNEALLAADRASLMAAAVSAAHDGLLPDGKEGVFVIYRSKQKDGRYLHKVQWQPMVHGILKKIRNSGQVTW